jgi:hypothetical protein
MTRHLYRVVPSLIIAGTTDKIMTFLQYLNRFSRPVARDTRQQSYEHYRTSAFRHSVTTASVSQLWYDPSSLPVLIIADAKDDILSALQQLY